MQGKTKIIKLVEKNKLGFVEYHWKKQSRTKYEEKDNGPWSHIQ